MSFNRTEVPSENVSVSQPERATLLSPVPTQPEPWHETNQRVAGRERAVAVRAALNASVVAAILSILPGGFIIGMPLGGFLAVLFYRRRSWRAEPSPTSGFRLGALTGLFGFLLLLALAGLTLFVSKGADPVRQQAFDVLRSASARHPDPQQRQLYEYFMTPQGLKVFLVLGAILMSVISVFMSGVGGTVAAIFLRRKGPRG